jgi:galactokinase
MSQFSAVDGTIFDIFVPGRLCILGEHTDWIANYRTTCPSLVAGHTLVCATNEGLHARVNVYPSSHQKNGTYFSKIRFIHRRSDTSGENETVFEHDLNSLTLKILSKQGGFNSYIAGTTAAFLDAISSGKIIPTRDILTSPYVIEIDNYRTTLPMKKGLSSSAAVCVLVVQSLAYAFSLSNSLSLMEMMDIAYQGEMYTPSQCGRMDQCVAMGSGAIALMTFLNETEIYLDPITCQCALYFVVVDLKAFKDTVVILRDLNVCFPRPQNTTQSLMHRYHIDMQRIAQEAKVGIEEGRVDFIAKAMNEAQCLFDECAMPNCPSQLTSPKLHALMDDTFIKEHSLAVKGVGSQGDGSAQILVKSVVEQEKILQYVKQTLGLDGFVLTIPAQTVAH